MKAVTDTTEHSGCLYLCPTPIGNMEDITYRTVRILSEADLIAAEDTRHTGLLLQHYNIKKPLFSYHEHNKEEKGKELISRMKDGCVLALVSDAGMPAISDPGADLVLQAIAEHIPVIPLPGANAALTALIASGQDTREFTFVGFLPKRKNNRIAILERIKGYEGTLIFYETPHRLQDILNDMLTVLGNRPVTVGRELTKKFETFTRTTLETLTIEEGMLTVKGEFVIVVGGAQTIPEPLITEGLSEVSPAEAVLKLIDSGMAKKEAIRQIARERNLARREIYQAVETLYSEGHSREGVEI